MLGSSVHAISLMFISLQDAQFVIEGQRVLHACPEQTAWHGAMSAWFDPGTLNIIVSWGSVLIKVNRSLLWRYSPFMQLNLMYNVHTIALGDLRQCSMHEQSDSHRKRLHRGSKSESADVAYFIFPTRTCAASCELSRFIPRLLTHLSQMANSRAFIKPKGKDTTWVHKKTSSLKVDKKKKAATATGMDGGFLFAVILLVYLGEFNDEART